MPTPPSSSPRGGSGRPPRRSGAPGAGGTGRGGAARRGGTPPARAASNPTRRAGAPGARQTPRDDREPELPPWKRRADARAGDDRRGKDAGWGGVARRGAGRLRDEGTRG